MRSKKNQMTTKIKTKNKTSDEGRRIAIHPTWYSFIKFCESIKYGEIEKLKIQDGLPILAEEVKKKIKFIS